MNNSNHKRHMVDYEPTSAENLSSSREDENWVSEIPVKKLKYQFASNDDHGDVAEHPAAAEDDEDEDGEARDRGDVPLTSFKKGTNNTDDLPHYKVQWPRCRGRCCMSCCDNPYIACCCFNHTQ